MTTSLKTMETLQDVSVGAILLLTKHKRATSILGPTRDSRSKLCKDLPHSSIPSSVIHTLWLDENISIIRR